MKNIRRITVTKKQAERMTRKLIESWKTFERSWAGIGKMVNECLKKNVPAAMGMNAQQWLEKCIPGSASKAWRALRIHRALEGLPAKKVEQLTEGNAVALARLPEKQRKSKVWLEKAIETPNEDFKNVVDTEIAKKTGKPVEEFLRLTISLPRSVFDEFEKAVMKIGKILNLDLEYMPNRKVTAYEAMASLINGTSEKVLAGELIGQKQERDNERKQRGKVVASAPGTPAPGTETRSDAGV